jgi:deazaflavin-dependent oxidoreductase (nitroreductase family)
MPPVSAAPVRYGGLPGFAAALLRRRRIVRAPILFYRARLGFLFGSRLLMLEHAGRKTGKRRRVVLEVVGRPQPRTYIVASGFGSRAQWFRNVRAEPRVRVSIGFRRSVPALARPLTSEDARAAQTAYAARHPRAWGALKPVFEATLGDRIDPDGNSLPMVALQLLPDGGQQG